MGAHWVPLDYIGAAGVTRGACRLHFGMAWELLESVLRSLGVTLGPWASKMDAAGDHADIAKTYENRWFSMVLAGWRVIWEAWRRSWLSCWRTGWQLAGWLKGWLGVAGASWEAGWPKGPQEPRTWGRGKVNGLFGGQNHQIY